MVAVRLERDQRLTFVVAAAIATLAWGALVVYPHADGFASAFAMWNIMMVAMMLPALVPWLALFDPTQAARFAAGYFVVWGVYAFAAAAVQVELTIPARAGGAVLVVAGAFQFTSLKQSCLRKCRSPLGHLLTHWKSGRGFWVRVGVAHGVNCLGCCWALMALAFALGVMNVWWMAALTLLLVFEKRLPKGELFSRWIGVSLVACGAVWLLVA